MRGRKNEKRVIIEWLNLTWRFFHLQVSDKLICGSVYDYLSTRIMTGLLSDGEKLPSILELSDAFHLAPETIRAALLILAEDGYIRMEAKQGSWVTYQADRAAREEAVARYYAPVSYTHLTLPTIRLV